MRLDIYEEDPHFPLSTKVTLAIVQARLEVDGFFIPRAICSYTSRWVETVKSASIPRSIVREKLPNSVECGQRTDSRHFE